MLIALLLTVAPLKLDGCVASKKEGRLAARERRLRDGDDEAEVEAQASRSSAAAKR